MAEIAVTLVSTAAERLSIFLINESAALSDVVNQVEWIERELTLMQAFLQHVERSGSSSSQGQGDGLNKWADELNDVAREAEDALGNFVIKSVNRRRKGVLSLVDRYKVSKELERISKKMKDISHRRMNYEQTSIGVVVVGTPAETETSASASRTTPNAIVAPAVEKLSFILTQNLVTSEKVVNIVEEVRREVVGMQDVVCNLESTGELSEREKVWLEEVKGVCSFTLHVVGEFIESRRRCGSERKLGNEMKYIRTQIGDVLYRRLIYGVGEEDVGDDRKGSRSFFLPRLSLKLMILPKVPFVVFYIAIFPFDDIGVLEYLVVVFCLLILLFLAKTKSLVRLCKAKKKKQLLKRACKTLLLGALFDFVILIFSVSPLLPLWLLLPLQFESIFHQVIVRVVALWRSVEKNLQSIRRDLDLMLALFIDIGCVEGLNERQKVWVGQLRVVAQHAGYLVAAHQKCRFFSKLKFASEINHLLHEIRNVSDRKITYGIANMEGRKVLVTLGQGNQESGIEINTSVVEHNAQAHAPVPAPSLQDMNHVHEYRPVKGLQRKVQSIKGEKQLMDALFTDVREMGELDARSKVWVDQMRSIALETESVINEYASKLEDKPIHIRILNYRTRRVIKRKINQIKNAIQDASRRRKTYGSVQFQTRAESFSMVQRLRRGTQPSLVVKESNIVGFDDDVEVLLAQLLSDEERRCITSIVGIAGTGKTTLAKLIFDNSVVIDHFPTRVWVSVPQKDENYTVELLPQDIARQILGDQEEAKWPAEDLTQRLTTYLAKERYLIVIDNVQTSQFWDNLKTTIPDMSNGCRVLLTCRNSNVVTGPRTFVRQLQLLNDQDSWILFRRNLKVDDIPPELMKLGNDIVIKCGGLPSAIIKMANLFSERDVTYEEWSRVIAHLSKDQEPWSETLGTVDMNLPPYLRRCIFYFVLFPAQFEIPARRLVVLWVAEGLVHQVGSEDSPELAAGRYLTELIDLNMVQISKRKHNGKVKSCRFPHALWKLWLTKATESKFLLQGHTATNSDSIPKASIARRVADHLDENYICYDHIHGDNRSSSTPLRSYYKDVLSFLSFDAQEGSKPGEDIGNFLYSCISSNCFLVLRVLDLERVYKPQLPKNIGRLSQLRYLGLRWTYLESLPSSISSLLKLQTLDLKHTYINTLTSSIWKMQLRHLFLSETYRSRFPPQAKGNSLFDLQTLWGLFVDGESPVKGGLDKLVNIKKLGLTCQSMSLEQTTMTSQLDAVADWILRLEHLQSLRLKSRDEEGRPRDLPLRSLQNHPCLTDIYLLGTLSSSTILSQFPPSVIELTLSQSSLKDDPMQILNNLPDLRSLCLLSESYLGNTMSCHAGSFPQLRFLKIWKLEQLAEWVIEEGALPCLRQMEIRSCKRLEMLPDGLQHVKTLLELKLTNMPTQFKSRIRDTNSEDWYKVSHIPNVFIDDSH